MRNPLTETSLFSNFIAPEPLCENELLQSLNTTLTKKPFEGGIWVFSYGALLWNPCFETSSWMVGKLKGWSRKACLWSFKARGSIDQPGLVFGLEKYPSGECNGVIMEISKSRLESDLYKLWRREMHINLYVPKWLPIQTTQRKIMAITFVANTNHQFYAGRIPDNRAAQIIAGAEGDFGPCSDYYKKTVEALFKLGLKDDYLDKLMPLIKEGALDSNFQQS
ncbi:MAG: gamma-glutamylcyclotransferase [Rhodospirillaceae bacterium]|nr:gamma-glutamylcyclotransferase [Rhodospirillaceae bacterium]|tara:strand:- start:42 stop:707 length:666 start_codon:yes stop_codon:yes gene_type:complete